MVLLANHVTGTSKLKKNYKQIQLTTKKPKQPPKIYKDTHELNKMKLKPGLGASYTIRPGNGKGKEEYSYRTFTQRLVSKPSDEDHTVLLANYTMPGVGLLYSSRTHYII